MRWRRLPNVAICRLGDDAEARPLESSWLESQCNPSGSAGRPSDENWPPIAGALSKSNCLPSATAGLVPAGAVIDKLQPAGSQPVSGPLDHGTKP